MLMAGRGVAACLVTHGRDCMSRVQVKLAEQEVVRMGDSDVISRCRYAREVANVEVTRTAASLRMAAELPVARRVPPHRAIGPVITAPTGQRVGETQGCPHRTGVAGHRVHQVLVSADP
jgi:hypothetical protein